MIENLELAKKMYLEDGKLISSIVKQLNIDKNSFIEYLKEFGYYVTEKTRPSTAKKIRAALEECQISNESVTKIAKKYNLTPTLLVNIVKQYFDNVNVVGKPKFNEHIFDVIDTEEKAYWLGFLYADGYITQPHEERQAPQFGFEVSTRDKELLVQFQKDLETNTPIHVYKKEKSTYKHNYPMGRISISSKHLVNSLAKWGVIPNKTYFIKFPDFLPEDLLWAFLRGYSDGDGTIFCACGKYLTWELCGTKEFLEGLLHFLNKDLKFSQRWPERDVNNYQVSIRDSQGEILSKLYENATIFLNRKYQKFAEMQGRND